MDLVQMAIDAGGQEPDRELRVGGQPPRVMFVGASATSLRRHYGDLMVALGVEGFEVHALGHGDEALAQLESQGVVVHALPDSRRGGAELLGAAVLVQAAMIEHVPLLVHGLEGALGWVAILAGRRAGALATVMTQGVWEPGALDVGGVLGQLLGLGLIERPLELAVSVLARSVDVWVANSADAMRRLEGLGWMSHGRVEIMAGGGGVALDRFEPLRVGSPGQAREVLELPAAWSAVVGYHGPLTERAGADEVLACVEALASRHPSLGWLVCVEGGSEPQLLARFEAYVARGVVRFFDPAQGKMERCFGAMELLFVPTRQDEPSLSILEAAAMQRPALAYDVPANEALIEDGQTGRLLKRAEGGAEAAIEAIDALLKHPQQLRQQGLSARRLASTRFLRQDNYRQLMAIYDACIDGALGQLS